MEGKMAGLAFAASAGELSDGPGEIGGPLSMFSPDAGADFGMSFDAAGAPWGKAEGMEIDGSFLRASDPTEGFWSDDDAA